MVSNSRHSTSAEISYGVVVPVKTFGQAKARLASALTDPQRHDLARRAAGLVLEAAAPADTFVVCDDPDVAAWAVEHGATVLTPPQTGLNEAVTFGVAELQRRGYRRALVAHGDLPLAQDLGWVADFAGVSIVTDFRGDGTNVLGLPTSAPFQFSYGPGSGRRHRLEALRCQLSVRWIRHRQLSHDVDTPEDLDQLEQAVRKHLLDPPAQDSTTRRAP